MGAAAVQLQGQNEGLLAGSALVVPELTFLLQRPVQLHLQQPLLGLGDITYLTVLCAVADAHVEKAVRLNSADYFDESVLTAVEAECQRIRPGHSTTDTLTAIRLLQCYPYLHQALSNRTLQVVLSHPGYAYLHYVSLLNQVVMVASQIYHEASQPSHHRYIAHQLALLYQSINQLAGDTKPLRRVIECKFEEIKAVAESEYPFFDMATTEWLQQVTWAAREEVKACPAYMHKRLASILQTIQQIPSEEKS